MISDDKIKEQIKFTLEKTDFSTLGEKYQGKVRDCYTKGKQRIIIVTDKVSAFDRVLTTIPFKGQVLNQMANFWFEKTTDIVNNHVVDVPDQNVMVTDELEQVKVEMVVRGYLTGKSSTSAWTHYEKGVRNFCGNQLPDEMKMDQKFDKPIITPSTKADQGEHDESISAEECVKRGLVTQELMDKLSEISMALFARGTEIAAKQGIILVDTKYEFGLTADGHPVLIDEIHTPDSSRFWYADVYEERFEKGESQKKIDKEYIRAWLLDKGFKGDGDIPEIPEDVKIEAAKRYIKAFELITGQEFQSEPAELLPRIEENLKKVQLL
jgi:phosphoribosylaminoimidazole-succinocarboxamide synthase